MFKGDGLHCSVLSTMHNPEANSVNVKMLNSLLVDKGGEVACAALAGPAALGDIEDVQRGSFISATPRKPITTLMQSWKFLQTFKNSLLIRSRGEK